MTFLAIKLYPFLKVRVPGRYGLLSKVIIFRPSKTCWCSKIVNLYLSDNFSMYLGEYSMKYKSGKYNAFLHDACG